MPKPVHIGKSGSIRIPVTLFKDGRYCIAWRQFHGAKRTRETFTDKKKAIARADEIAQAIANGQSDVLTLSSADRDSYRLAVQAVAPFHLPLHSALEEYAAAKALLPQGASLIEAVQYYHRGISTQLKRQPAATIVEELINQLRDDGRDETAHISKIRKDLERFVTVFPDLTSVSETDIRAYLRGLKLMIGPTKGHPISLRRRDNVRDNIVTLFRFARKREYLPPEKTTVAEHIPRIAQLGDVTTYSPAEVQSILNHLFQHDPDWLPWAAIQAFAGMRTSEIFRLEWSAFNWKTGNIIVHRKVARKIRKDRQIPIQPNLRAWLTSWIEATGPVIPRKWRQLHNAQSYALERLRKSLKREPWDNNALRHSFGSNRLAIVKSYAQVSLEMGNSPGQVKKSYNDPKDEEEAQAYFAIQPPATLQNVIIFPAKAG